MKNVLKSALAFGVLMIFASAAMADVATVVVEPLNWWQTIFAQVQPALMSLFLGVGTIAITVVSGYISTHVSAGVGALANQLLQSGLQNAAGWVISKVGVQAVAQGHATVNSPAVVEAVTQLKASQPENIAKLKLTDKQLAEKVISKIGLQAQDVVGKVITAVVEHK